MLFLNSLLTKIKGGSTKMTTSDIDKFVERRVQEFLTGSSRLDMICGEEYYLNHMEVTKSSPQHPNQSDQQNKNAFVRTIVDQKCNYLFGNRPTFHGENEQYLSIINHILTEDFATLLYNTCEECINKGIAFVQPYVENDVLKFKLHKSEEIIPIWIDGEHTQLTGFIRVFTKLDSNYKSQCIVEYWTQSQVTYYSYSNNNLIYNDSKNIFQENLDDASGNVPQGFDKVPLVAFKYNRQQEPFINLVKTLVDTYNLIDSISSDVLIDIPSYIYVLVNYGGANLEEFTQGIREYKAIKVEGDGDVKKLSAEVDMTHINAKLTMLAQNIYKFGRGVDTQNDKIGSSSGVAIQYKYSDLDLDCKKIERYFKQGFKDLSAFINWYILQVFKEDFSNEKIELICNKDIVTGVGDKINNLVKLNGIISQHTLLANLPYVTDVNGELNQILQENSKNKN